MIEPESKKDPSSKWTKIRCLKQNSFYKRCWKKRDGAHSDTIKQMQSSLLSFYFVSINKLSTIYKNNCIDVMDTYISLRNMQMYLFIIGNECLTKVLCSFKPFKFKLWIDLSDESIPRKWFPNNLEFNKAAVSQLLKTFHKNMTI